MYIGNTLEEVWADWNFQGTGEVGGKQAAGVGTWGSTGHSPGWKLDQGQWPHEEKQLTEQARWGTVSKCSFYFQGFKNIKGQSMVIPG